MAVHPESQFLLILVTLFSGLGATETERQEKYQQWIDPQIDEGEWEEIRQATQRGHLIGRETFKQQVEAMTGRHLVGEARGRPKRAIAIAIEKVLCPHFISRIARFPNTRPEAPAVLLIVRRQV